MVDTAATQGDTTPNGNTNIRRRARNWCFTLNNYTSKNIDTLTQLLCEYVFQEETGEKGTQHLQGVLMYKNAVSFNTIKDIIPNAHIEICRNKKASIKYCQKEETRTGKVYKNLIEEDEIIDPLEGKQLFKFQKDILNIIEAKPSKRKIFWFWEHDGCTGKTSIAKSICIKDKTAMYLSGKGNDILYAVSCQKTKPKVILYDIPRSIGDYISYNALEKLKDGIFFSGKYESKQVVMNTPTIICFSNSPPDKSKLSQDRWIIREIKTEI